MYHDGWSQNINHIDSYTMKKIYFFKSYILFSKRTVIILDKTMPLWSAIFNQSYSHTRITFLESTFSDSSYQLLVLILYKPVYDLKTVNFLEYKKVIFLLPSIESDHTWKHSKFKKIEISNNSNTTKTCFQSFR